VDHHPQTTFHTVSEGEFSEVHLHDRAYNALSEERECLSRPATPRGRRLHVVVLHEDPRT
jgi:hypothetical protein